MSASHPGARTRLGRGDSIVPKWLKDAGRLALLPVIRLAQALHLTPNTVTVIGLLIVAGASLLIFNGLLLAGAAVLLAGSLLDAVDGALARLQGGGTAFGSFLDSTLDRVGEAILYAGIVGWWLRVEADPTLPVLAAILALIGSFMVSYSRARAEGIGVSAAVGLAPRTERLALVIAGVALAGLGWPVALLAILWLIVALTAATVVQRIWHVWQATQGQPAPSTSVSEHTQER
ncbi:MAG: CDP-alcohol phosphatidyltransferase family protein [Chloroflexota bacterium]